MKIKELIKKLSELDGELMVVISGYEGGVDEVEKIKPVELALDFHSDDWMGKHEEVVEGNSRFDCKAIKLI